MHDYTTDAACRPAALRDAEGRATAIGSPAFARSLSEHVSRARLRVGSPLQDQRREGLGDGGIRRVFDAVHCLSLRVAPHRITGFPGCHGAGKRTAIAVLLGMPKPASGVGTVLGRRIGDPARWPASAKTSASTPT